MHRKQALMSSNDPTVVVRQMDPAQRREFFCQWPKFQVLDWAQLNKKRKVEPLLAALKDLDSIEKRKIAQLLALFVSLKSERGLRILSGEIDRWCPEARSGWDDAVGKLDKVVYSYLHTRKAFENALIVAQADGFENRRGWNTWPPVACGDFRSDEETLDQLRLRLVEYHSGELRGDVCEINHFHRGNDAHYIFAYLPDWPDNQMVFSEAGELESLKLPMAFSILFVYTPCNGQYAMICSGGKKKQADMRRLFYETTTDTKVEDLPPNRAAFKLDHILEGEFRFDRHNVPGVKSVEVSSLSWSSLSEHADPSWVCTRFKEGTTWPQNVEILDRMLAAYEHQRSQIKIESIHLRLQFLGHQHKQLTIRVTPNTCSIKSDDDQARRVMCERCVQAWGFEQ